MRSSNQPGQLARNPPVLADALPLFGLAPCGVCHADPVARIAVRSYRTLSPLPWDFHPFGGLLSVALSLEGRPDLTTIAFPPAGVTRHPRFVEPGLSSAGINPDAAAPPPDACALAGFARGRKRGSWMKIFLWVVPERPGLGAFPILTLRLISGGFPRFSSTQSCVWLTTQSLYAAFHLCCRLVTLLRHCVKMYHIAIATCPVRHD